MARGTGHEHGHGHEHHHDREERTPAMMDHEEAQDRLLECIEECLNCHVSCTMTVQHCLASGGELSDVNLVGVLLDCAELSQTSANFMLRGSPYHALTCASCAELCRSCEELCRADGERDEQLMHCAEVCATCADLCEAMVAMAAEDEGEEEDDDED
jgi:hypothetical protein